MELSSRSRTFEALLGLLCQELNVEKELIVKVRKLPNTILRKDSEVRRLKDYTEIEVVVGKRSESDGKSPPGYSPSVSLRNIDVVY